MAGRIRRRSPPSRVAAARRDDTRGEPVPGRHEVRARPLALVVLILVTVGACAPGPASPSTADAVLVVLRVDGRPVGAWIGPGGNSSGVLPADARP